VRLQPLGHLSGESAGYADQLQKSMHALEDSAMGFNEFIRERRYLKNVSPATISWYTHALKWLPNESPSQIELKEVVLRMREKDMKANAFTLLLTLCENHQHLERLNHGALKSALIHFGENPPTDYALAAKEGVNNKRERTLRSRHVQRILSEAGGIPPLP
jgi:hypothetical protein